MGFLQTLTTDEIHQYHSMVTRSVEVRSHFDMLVWLQGDMQRYLPHQIMLTAWGDFGNKKIHHNIISGMVGVRSRDAYANIITPMLLQLFARWGEFDYKPYALKSGVGGFCHDCPGPKNALTDALQTMRSAMVHGIKDERGCQDCLYVAFSIKDAFTDAQRSVMSLVLPYIDSALRQVAHLPHQRQAFDVTPIEGMLQKNYDLSDREAEILHWVAAGKTNPEIGMILDISAFTVKNHMKRVFQKLNVSNRAQAVSTIRSLLADV